MNIGAHWTDTRTDTLRQLAADGLSASQIAVELGGITRNAVCGKLSRMGLSTAKVPTAPRPRRPKATRSTPFRIFGIIDTEPEEATDLPADQSPDACTLMALKENSCRWPMGHPSEASFRFCGSPKHPAGGSYCGRHARLAYKPAPHR